MKEALKRKAKKALLVLAMTLASCGVFAYSYFDQHGTEIEVIYMGKVGSDSYFESVVDVETVMDKLIADNNGDYNCLFFEELPAEVRKDVINAVRGSYTIEPKECYCVLLKSYRGNKKLSYAATFKIIDSISNIEFWSVCEISSL